MKNFVKFGKSIEQGFGSGGLYALLKEMQNDMIELLSIFDSPDGKRIKRLQIVNGKLEIDYEI